METESSWEICQFMPPMAGIWDKFVHESRNSTFLFYRDYISYHADRFQDCSMMAFKNGRLMGLLPANIDGDTLHSHQGLTYGGWILPPRGLDTADFFGLWKEWLRFCREMDIKRAVYKPLPYIYSMMPSQEDLYMLFLSKARISRCDISSTVDLEENPGFNKLQKRHLKHRPSGFEVRTVSISDPEGIAQFHTMLTRCLRERHGASPVHSLEELQRLMNLFPGEILIWTACIDGEMKGGICAYVTSTCLHCQYIATTPEGRSLNVLAPLVEEMMRFYQESGCRYFDFGISNEDGGRLLNTGLNRQKTSYGGSGVAYQRYEFSVSYALKSLPTSLWPPR